MIPKREFNPELSAFSNLVLDLVDFKDRVRPMAEDITRLDVTKQWQPKTLAQVKDAEERLMEHLEIFGVDMAEIDGAAAEDEGQRSLDDRGYSSLEIAEKSGGETDAAKPDMSAEAREALDAETDPDQTQDDAPDADLTQDDDAQAADQTADDDADQTQDGEEDDDKKDH